MPVFTASKVTKAFPLHSRQVGIDKQAVNEKNEPDANEKVSYLL